MNTITEIISAIFLSAIIVIVSSQASKSCDNQIVCKPLQECGIAKRLIRINQELLKKLTCKFEGSEPWVCCDNKLQDGISFLESTVLPSARTTHHKVPKTTETEPTYRTTPLPPNSISPEFPDSQVSRVGTIDNIEVTKETTPTATYNVKKRSNLLPNRTVCGQTIVHEEVDTRIYGGRLSRIGEFPWTVRLRRDGKYGCMGTLINEYYVLTAAHCAVPSANLTDVRLGEWDEETVVDCDQETGMCSDAAIDIKVSETIVHPEYTRSARKVGNDIALLRLETPVKFSKFIRPICLPTTAYIQTRDYTNSMQYTASGWGRTEYAQKSVILKTLTLSSVEMDICRGSTLKDIEKVDVNKIICAGGKKGEDTCNGDSGSGIVKKEKEESQTGWFIYGITSFGIKNCGTEGYPAVYTRVSAYMDWIVDTLRP